MTRDSAGVVDVIASASAEELLAGLMRSRAVKSVTRSAKPVRGAQRVMVYMPIVEPARATRPRARKERNPFGLDDGPAKEV